MFKRKLLVSTLFAAMLPAAAILAPTTAHAYVDVSVHVAPPALRYERLPAPRAGYFWVPGCWEWRGYDYVWIPGYFERERVGYVYAPSYWVARGGRWYYESARWNRHDGHYGRVDYRNSPYGDRDRDGIVNRYDPNPNVPNYRGGRGTNNGYGDRDGDGIVNRYDPNPNVQNVRGGRGYNNGYGDRDRDGIPDRVDPNPNQYNPAPRGPGYGNGHGRGHGR